jgi:hypothetical protein
MAGTVNSIAAVAAKAKAAFIEGILIPNIFRSPLRIFYTNIKIYRKSPRGEPQGK